MHNGVTSHLWLKSASYASSHPCMRTCVLFLVCLLPCVLRFLPRLTVLLPALPDVHLSVQREVHVKPPVLLQLGERGHIRLRHTPHKTRNGPLLGPLFSVAMGPFERFGCLISKHGLPELSPFTWNLDSTRITKKTGSARHSCLVGCCRGLIGCACGALWCLVCEQPTA